MSIYQSSILNHPARIAPFLALLRTLKLGLQGSRRSLQWWDILSDPIIIHLGIEKGLAAEAKESLLDLLIYDEEEEENLKEAKATSDDLAEVLMSTWLAKSKLALEELNEHAKFVEEQLQAIMLAFGRRRPKVRVLDFETRTLLIDAGLSDDPRQIHCEERKPDSGPLPPLRILQTPASTSTPTPPNTFIQ